MNWKVRYATTPPINGEVTHDATINPTWPQATALKSIATAPNPTIAPTMACVVETGRP